MNEVSYETMWMKWNLSKTCHRFFSTLANPTRLAILELLRDRPRNVTEISQELNQEQSMISHNLKLLEKCKFVFSERKKKNHFYSLNKETMEQMFKIFSYHAEKYCPTEGKCLSEKDLSEKRKKDTQSPLYVTRY